MSEPKGTAVGEQDSVAARLMLLMKVRRRPAAAMQPLQRRHRAYRARYRQHHQATVRYRLRQITELFGDQLRDPDRRFELQLALRVRQLEGSRVAGRGNPPRSAPKDTEAATDGQP